MLAHRLDSLDRNIPAALLGDHLWHLLAPRLLINGLANPCVDCIVGGDALILGPLAGSDWKCVAFLSVDDLVGHVALASFW